jgi:upstream activation factor subunit UAF30
MSTKASKETKTPKEAKAPKEAKTSTETKASKAAKALKEKGGKAESASAGGQKPNALQKPLQPSKELAAVVGSGPLPRGEVVSKVWDYIKRQDLQNPENRREILADDKKLYAN